jgi:hypothetical protein
VAQRFCITHPFHPAFGKEFELVAWRQSWGEDRVYYQDGAGRLRSFPASFTSMAAADPFVEIAAGRSFFRMEDLIRLTILVEQLKQNQGGNE